MEQLAAGPRKSVMAAPCRGGERVDASLTGRTDGTGCTCRASWRALRLCKPWILRLMEAAYGDLAAVDAVAAGGGSAFERLVRRRTTIAIVVANALGALLVFVFLAFVVPVPSVSHPGRLTLLNLAVFVAAMPVGFWIGRAWSLRIAAPTRAWLISGRVPASSERELALRQPLQLATVGAVLWALAAVLFAGLNAAYSPATGVEAGGTIVLGGLATCALVYLLAERTLRPITALALAAGAPARPVLPGAPSFSREPRHRHGGSRPQCSSSASSR